jgi:hypothetical protein
MIVFAIMMLLCTGVRFAMFRGVPLDDRFFAA